MRLIVFPLTALLVVGLLTGCGGDDDSDSSASELEGTAWVLTSGVDVEGWEAVAPSATFGQGRVAGSTGCNRFTASYTMDGDELDIGQVASTLMGCEPVPAAVERAYVAALEQVTSWRTEDAALVLLGANGDELLRYEAASPRGDWEATGILSATAFSSPIPGTTITASFDEGGQLSGSAGCNTYRATYTADRGTIEITPPASTKKLCAEPEGVMEQEAAYLAALPKATRYQVDGGRLDLLRADGTHAASYVRANRR